MAIASMTGFGRSEGAGDGFVWAWEARSVNGRGLDVRLRLPSGNDAIELAAREAIAKRIVRGNVSATLTIDRQAAGGTLRLNESVLADILRAADRVIEIAGGQRPDTATLLGIKGVLEQSEGGENADARSARERRPGRPHQRHHPGRPRSAVVLSRISRYGRSARGGEMGYATPTRGPGARATTVGASWLFPLAGSPPALRQPAALEAESRSFASSASCPISPTRKWGK